MPEIGQSVNTRNDRANRNQQGHPMSASRYYKIEDQSSIWVIKAASQAQAIRYVAMQTMTCALASTDEVVKHIQSGAKIHDLSNLPAEPKEGDA